MNHPVEAQINLSALQNNFRLVQQSTNGQRIMAVIKADGYGHGIIPIAKALQNTDAYGVARLEEAITLRNNNIQSPITILSERLDHAGLQYCSENNISVVVFETSYAESIRTARLSKPLDLWLKIDTGMHRLGITAKEVSARYRTLKQSTNVNSITLMSHFASADETQNCATEKQLMNFAQATEGISETKCLANSAAIMAWPQSHADWVRPGIMLYGADPLDTPNTLSQQLQPVMQLYAQLINIIEIEAGESIGYNARWTAQRPSRVATVCIGYADGYPRHARNGTPVSINTVRAPLIGQVSMDMISVDITDHPNAKLGDKVMLWGSGLPANEIAKCSDTIAYHLFTGVGKRVKFSYFQNNALST